MITTVVFGRAEDLGPFASDANVRSVDVDGAALTITDTWATENFCDRAHARQYLAQRSYVEITPDVWLCFGPTACTSAEFVPLDDFPPGPVRCAWCGYSENDTDDPDNS